MIVNIFSIQAKGMEIIKAESHIRYLNNLYKITCANFHQKKINLNLSGIFSNTCIVLSFDR